ncbi:MAG: redoxin domain-containing protein [Vicinamibacterales bacterium]
MSLVGKPAPEFTLPNQDRQPVALREEWSKGPVILAFFPAAFSSVCTSELCTLRDRFAALAGSRARVFGVSVDSFFALAAFAKAEHLPYPLLSDFNKDVIRLYDVYNPDMIGLKGVAKRAVFLIDGAGVVRHEQVVDDARLEPDYDGLGAALAAL